MLAVFSWQWQWRPWQKPCWWQMCLDTCSPLFVALLQIKVFRIPVTSSSWSVPGKGASSGTRKGWQEGAGSARRCQCLFQGQCRFLVGNACAAGAAAISRDRSFTRAVCMCMHCTVITNSVHYYHVRLWDNWYCIWETRDFSSFIYLFIYFNVYICERWEMGQGLREVCMPGFFFPLH